MQQRRHTLGSITLLGASNEGLLDGLRRSGRRGGSGLGGRSWLLRKEREHIGAHFSASWMLLGGLLKAYSVDLNSIPKKRSYSLRRCDPSSNDSSNVVVDGSYAIS